MDVSNPPKNLMSYLPEQSFPAKPTLHVHTSFLSGIPSLLHLWAEKMKNFGIGRPDTYSREQNKPSIKHFIKQSRVILIP